MVVVVVVVDTDTDTDIVVVASVVDIAADIVDSVVS